MQSYIKDLGIALEYGDLKNPSTLEDACREFKTVISTASSIFSRQQGDSIESVDLQGQMNLVDAAREGGVRHFIFISFSPFLEDFALQRAKRAVEQRLTKCGLPYTVLQPTFFMEVWLSPAVGFDFANLRAQIYGSGENKISWISCHNVARFALASMDRPAARNHVIKLGGPEALSPLEVVRIFQEVSGQQFTVNHVSIDALRAQRVAAVDSLQEAFAALMLCYAHGDMIDMQPAFNIFPIQASELVTVRDYARHVLRL